jgi:hypothetical protein
VFCLDGPGTAEELEQSILVSVSICPTNCQKYSVNPPFTFDRVCSNLHVCGSLNNHLMENSSDDNDNKSQVAVVDASTDPFFHAHRIPL